MGFEEDTGGLDLVAEDRTLDDYIQEVHSRKLHVETLANDWDLHSKFTEHDLERLSEGMPSIFPKSLVHEYIHTANAVYVGLALEANPEMEFKHPDFVYDTWTSSFLKSLSLADHLKDMPDKHHGGFDYFQWSMLTAVGGGFSGLISMAFWSAVYLKSNGHGFSTGSLATCFIASYVGALAGAIAAYAGYGVYRRGSQVIKDTAQKIKDANFEAHSRLYERFCRDNLEANYAKARQLGCDLFDRLINPPAIDDNAINEFEDFVKSEKNVRHLRYVRDQFRSNLQRMRGLPSSPLELPADI